MSDNLVFSCDGTIVGVALNTCTSTSSSSDLTITWGWDDHYSYPQQPLSDYERQYNEWVRLNAPAVKPNLPEGVEMKALYEVVLCYGEDRKNPIVIYAPKAMVVAESEEDAKIKSGAYGAIDPTWDADFLTILVRKFGDVRIKERAKEVKQV